MRTTQTVAALTTALGVIATPAAAANGVLIVLSFRAGAVQTVSEVTDASRQTFADALFQVPAGYQKREFPGMGRGRGRQ
jgi:hypothetical protein